MKERKLICIMCPNGCEMTVKYDDKQILQLEGNTCPKGAEYAENECFHPVRTVTSTVRTDSGRITAVRTSQPIPKDMIFKVMDAITEIRPADASAVFGAVLIKDVCGTGADVVVTGYENPAGAAAGSSENGADPANSCNGKAPADLEYWKAKAMECGFTHVGDLDVDTIQVRTEARDACAVNKCKKYNTNWSCPPGCGTLEECSEMLHKFKRGILVQTTGEVDSLDYESFMNLAKDHQAHFKEFSAMVKAEAPGAMLIGASACSNCEKCTYPDAPCRFPEKLSHPMEALGMIVSDVCKNNNIKYYYGPGTLTYTGCVLLD